MGELEQIEASNTGSCGRSGTVELASFVNAGAGMLRAVLLNGNHKIQISTITFAPFEHMLVKR
jgi:hypothetical protein